MGKTEEWEPFRSSSVPNILLVRTFIDTATKVGSILDDLLRPKTLWMANYSETPIYMHVPGASRLESPGWALGLFSRFGSETALRELRHRSVTTGVVGDHNLSDCKSSIFSIYLGFSIYSGFSSDLNG
ncbi:unnamed protein product [Brassica oleracea var. botrytis]|uniref:(rape) hypothetical protein n=1 Tax=Brassica napus TaxID=3708 RepID=A0A816IWY3_BRANA|nr:unnamed protein product [Brassica napus]